MVNNAAKAFVALINLGSGATGLPQTPTAALNSLSTAGSLAFNQRFPQALPADCGSGPELVNGVRYYSWTGTQPVTNVLDVSDGPLGIMSLTFGQANDGLVSACSSRLGKHLGDYRQNHLDEVNQVLGLRDWFAADPVTLYRQHANRLKQASLLSGSARRRWRQRPCPCWLRGGGWRLATRRRRPRRPRRWLRTAPAAPAGPVQTLQSCPRRPRRDKTQPARKPMPS